MHHPYIPCCVGAAPHKKLQPLYRYRRNDSKKPPVIFTRPILHVAGTVPGFGCRHGSVRLRLGAGTRPGPKADRQSRLLTYTFRWRYLWLLPFLKPRFDYYPDTGTLKVLGSYRRALRAISLSPRDSALIGK
jgi:hypothetical protein